jgi:hypothetical protein
MATPWRLPPYTTACHLVKWELAVVVLLKKLLSE